VAADEALAIGLVNRVVPRGKAREAAEELGRELAAFPQGALRGDRLSAYEQWDLERAEALSNELAHGMRALAEGVAGAERFGRGAGRHGQPESRPAEGAPLRRGESEGGSTDD
jgi:enoyl-CoA hydratase